MAILAELAQQPGVNQSIPVRIQKNSMASQVMTGLFFNSQGGHAHAAVHAHTKAARAQRTLAPAMMLGVADQQAEQQQAQQEAAAAAAGQVMAAPVQAAVDAATRSPKGRRMQAPNTVLTQQHADADADAVMTNVATAPAAPGRGHSGVLAALQ